MSNIIEQDQIVAIVPAAFGGWYTLVIVDEAQDGETPHSYYYSGNGGHEGTRIVDYYNSWDDVEDGLSDVEADAMTLESAGWGTEEDYGYYGDGEDY